MAKMKLPHCNLTKPNEPLKEFKRKCGGDEDVISEKDFAELLIAYAGFPPKKKVKMLKRVRKAFKASAAAAAEEEGGEENKSPGENVKMHSLSLTTLQGDNWILDTTEPPTLVRVG